MVAYYVVQGVRYFLIPVYGCDNRYDASWVTVVMFLVPPVIMCLVSWYYTCKSFPSSPSLLQPFQNQTNLTFSPNHLPHVHPPPHHNLPPHLLKNNKNPFPPPLHPKSPRPRSRPPELHLHTHQIHPTRFNDRRHTPQLLLVRRPHRLEPSHTHPRRLRRSTMGPLVLGRLWIYHLLLFWGW